MKKFLICLMSVLFIFIGCSKMDIQDTDVNYDRTEIVFNSGLITKAATIIDGTSLLNDWKFGIAATYTSEYGSGVDENGNTFNEPDETDFFDGFKTVEKDTEHPEVYHVTEGGPYYWPRTGSMTFYALANGTIKPNATWDKTNVKLTLTGYDLGVIDNQKDLLYAKTEVSDVTYSTNAVNLNFNHTLAQIIFKFSKSTILNSTTVNVTSVIVSVPKTVADFDSSVSGYWTNLSGGANIPVLSSSYTCTATPTVAGEAILVFPQTLPDNAIVTINYQTNVLGWIRNRVATIKGGALKGEWLAGHKYTYNIEVSTSEILFTSNVNNWTDDGNVIY